MGEPPDGGAPHVLLVEDNPGDVRLVREAVEECAVESSLAVATDGERALDYLFRRGDHESAERPDLVLLDLNVPKVSGGAVLDEMDGEGDLRSTPVVVLTGSESPDDAVETDAQGADCYLVKPVNPTEFIELVRSVVETFADAGALPAGVLEDAVDVR